MSIFNSSNSGKKNSKKTRKLSKRNQKRLSMAQGLAGLEQLEDKRLLTVTFDGVLGGTSTTPLSHPDLGASGEFQTGVTPTVVEFEDLTGTTLGDAIVVNVVTLELGSQGNVANVIPPTLTYSDGAVDHVIAPVSTAQATGFNVNGDGLTDGLLASQFVIPVNQFGGGSLAGDKIKFADRITQFSSGSMVVFGGVDQTVPVGWAGGQSSDDTGIAGNSEINHDAPLGTMIVDVIGVFRNNLDISARDAGQQELGPDSWRTNTGGGLLQNLAVGSSWEVADPGDENPAWEWGTTLQGMAYSHAAIQLNMELPPGQIHGVKYHDLNANGVYDQDDAEFSGGKFNGGTVFQLERVLNGQTTLVGYQATGPDHSYTFPPVPGNARYSGEIGEFWFEGLRPGDYKISEVAYIDVAGDNNGKLDSGDIFTDVNQDGIPDIDQDMVLDLAPRVFTITENQEVRSNHSTHPPTTGTVCNDELEIFDNCVVTLDEGQLDWGNYIEGSLHGVKWHDVDGDGIWDDSGDGKSEKDNPGNHVRDFKENALPGIKFRLWTYGGGVDGNRGTGNVSGNDPNFGGQDDDWNLVGTATTDAHGDFWFTDLKPGFDYYVEEFDSGVYTGSSHINYPRINTSHPPAHLDPDTDPKKIENKDVQRYYVSSGTEYVWKDGKASAPWDANGDNLLQVKPNDDGFNPDDMEGFFDPNAGVGSNTVTGADVYQSPVTGFYYNDYAAGNNMGALKTESLDTRLMWGNFIPATFEGFKYEDVDGNKKYDPNVDRLFDDGTVVFELKYHGPDGVLGSGGDDGGPWYTTADADGNFGFDNLTPGRYTIREVDYINNTDGGKEPHLGPKDRFTDTNKDGIPDVDQDLVFLTDEHEFVVYSNGTRTETDGNKEANKDLDPYKNGPAWANYVNGSIHGFKFHDRDGDGVFDGLKENKDDKHYDEYLEDVNFELWKYCGFKDNPGQTTAISEVDSGDDFHQWELIDEVSTNQHGEFWFTGLAPTGGCTYYVFEVDSPDAIADNGFDPKAAAASYPGVSTGQATRPRDGDGDGNAPNNSIADEMGTFAPPSNAHSYDINSRVEIVWEAGASSAPMDQNGNGLLEINPGANENTRYKRPLWNAAGTYPNMQSPSGLTYNDFDAGYNHGVLKQEYWPNGDLVADNPDGDGSALVWGNFQYAEIGGFKYHDVNNNNKYAGGSELISAWSSHGGEAWDGAVIFELQTQTGIDANGDPTWSGSTFDYYNSTTGAFDFTKLAPGTHRVREVDYVDRDGDGKFDKNDEGSEFTRNGDEDYYTDVNNDDIRDSQQDMILDTDWRSVTVLSGERKHSDHNPTGAAEATYSTSIAGEDGKDGALDWHNVVTGSIHGFKFHDKWNSNDAEGGGAGDGVYQKHPDNNNWDAPHAGAKFELWSVEKDDKTNWVLEQTTTSGSNGRFHFWGIMPTGRDFYVFEVDSNGLQGSSTGLPTKAEGVAPAGRPDKVYVTDTSLEATGDTGNARRALLKTFKFEIDQSGEEISYQNLSVTLKGDRSNIAAYNPWALKNENHDPTDGSDNGPDDYGAENTLMYGNYNFGSIKVEKYEDLNGNGKADAGEPGLENVQFELRGWTNNWVTADAVAPANTPEVAYVPNGPNTEAGKMFVSITQDHAANNTTTTTNTPSDPTRMNSYPSNYNVRVFGKTDADGMLVFDNLPPGDYYVFEVTPDSPDANANGRVTVDQDLGGGVSNVHYFTSVANKNPFGDGTVGSPDGVEDALQGMVFDTHVVRREPGSGSNIVNETNKNKAEYNQLQFNNYVRGSVHGAKFHDVNGDGIQQLDVDKDGNLIEDVLAGVQFQLYRFHAKNPGGERFSAENSIDTYDWRFVRTTVTNSHGEYWFEDLDPGTYAVVELAPEEYPGISTGQRQSNAWYDDRVFNSFDDDNAGDAGSGENPDGDGRYVAYTDAVNEHSRMSFDVNVTGPTTASWTSPDGTHRTAQFVANASNVMLDVAKDTRVEFRSQWSGFSVNDVDVRPRVLTNNVTFGSITGYPYLGGTTNDKEGPNSDHYEVESRMEFVWRDGATLMDTCGGGDHGGQIEGLLNEAHLCGPSEAVDGDNSKWISLKMESQDNALYYGNFQFASVKGFKYEDFDGSGRHNQKDIDVAKALFDDSGHRAGMENVSFYLIGTDGLGKEVRMVEKSNSDGIVTFSGLWPGSYQIQEIDKINVDPTNEDGKVKFKDFITDTNGDKVQDTLQHMTIYDSELRPAFNLTSGQDRGIDNRFDKDLNFKWGNYIQNSIHGFKFYDFDGDGYFDTQDDVDEGHSSKADVPLVGTTFNLYRFVETATDTPFSAEERFNYRWELVDQQVTDVHGNFWFTGLQPTEQYVVREDLSVDNELIDLDGDGNPDPLLASGYENSTHCDFTDWEIRAAAGEVVCDVIVTDLDEDGVPDDFNNDGVVDGEPSGKPSDDPTLFTMYSGVEYVWDNPLAENIVDAKRNVPSGLIGNNQGKTYENVAKAYRQGNWIPGPESEVMDEDNDGRLSDDEIINGYNAGALKHPVVAADWGTFNDLQNLAGTDTGIGGPSEGGYLFWGNRVTPGEVHGLKFHDLDADGDWDNDLNIYTDIEEPGLANIEIILRHRISGEESTVTTNRNGHFWFLDIVPGDYEILEDLNRADSNRNGIPDGHEGMKQSNGGGAVTVMAGRASVFQPGASKMGRHGDESPDELFVDSGEGFDENLTLGNYITGSVHGFKFTDLDADGVYEENTPWNHDEFPFEWGHFQLFEADGVTPAKAYDYESESWLEIPVQETGAPNDHFDVTCTERLSRQGAQAILRPGNIDCGEFWFENLKPGTYILSEVFEGVDRDDIVGGTNGEGDGYPDGDGTDDILEGLKMSTPNHVEVVVESGSELAWRENAAMLDSNILTVYRNTPDEGDDSEGIANARIDVNFNGEWIPGYWTGGSTGVGSYVLGRYDNNYSLPNDTLCIGDCPSGSAHNTLLGSGVIGINFGANGYVQLDGGNIVQVDHYEFIDIDFDDDGKADVDRVEFGGVGSTVSTNRVKFETSTLRTEHVVGEQIMFGNYHTGAIYGTKAHYGSGENADGIPIELYDENGNWLATSFTQNGQYGFEDLDPGHYTVCEGDSPGVIDGASPCISVMVDYGQVVMATAGQATTQGPWPAHQISGIAPTVVNPSLAFTNKVEGGIHGVKYHAMDIDGDGIANDPIAGLEFKLYGGGGVLTAITDANGEYGFTGLSPATYTLIETQGGAVISSSVPAPEIIEVNSGDVVVAYSGQADLLPGQNETVNGNLEMTNLLYGSIHGTLKHLDGTPFSAGFVVELFEWDPVNRVQGTLVDTVGSFAPNSDGNSEYVFDDVMPGHYIVIPAAGPTAVVDLVSGEAEVSVAGQAGTLLAGQFESVHPTIHPVFGENTLCHIYPDDWSSEIAAVRVGSTAWTPLFNTMVDEVGAENGNAVGYSIPTGTNGEQDNAVPWTNINEITIDFTGGINGGRGPLVLDALSGELIPTPLPIPMDAFDLIGGEPGVPVPSITGLHYDAGLYRVTLSLDGSLPSNQYALTIDSTKVLDMMFNELDGDFLNHTIALPSGNGTAGGDFVFNFNVLHGNVHGNSDIVGFQDLLAFSGAWDTRATLNPNYDPMADPNGDGRVTFGDLLAFSGSWQAEMPGTAPVALPPSAAGDAAAIDAIFGSQDDFSSDDDEEEVANSVAIQVARARRAR